MSTPTRLAAATTIPRPADRDAWLAARRPYFNASAVGALFGEHPFTTLAEVVRGKLEPDLETPESALMRLGSCLEPGIAAMWEHEHGIALYEPGVLYCAGPLMATLDRRIVGNDAEAVEIKYTTKHVSRPERYWWWQCQAQMHCAALERVHLAVVDAGGFKEFTVERDDEAIGRLVAAAFEVMGPVGRGEWPPTVAHDPPARHSDRVVELDDDAREVLAAWLAVREQLHDLEVLEERHKRRLTETLGDAQAATVDGRQVLSYRSHTRTNIDLARLRAEHADLAAELSVAQVVRVLRPADRSLLPPVTPLV